MTSSNILTLGILYRQGNEHPSAVRGHTVQRECFTIDGLRAPADYEGKFCIWLGKYLDKYGDQPLTGELLVAVCEARKAVDEYHESRKGCKMMLHLIWRVFLEELAYYVDESDIEAFAENGDRDDRAKVEVLGWYGIRPPLARMRPYQAIRRVDELLNM
ncbi:hypothetical protein FBU59_005359 [Linderina macrospora]|uniref:Uncharacterized protein n=1 Tax=Linderina macrospora TaxID=4868 RepID=A0ACC1J2V6_9FUNG|nr:hypothetical protein FBU59_005359 [Linderina macrospora]